MSLVSPEQRVPFLADVFIHANQPGPEAFQAFAGQLLRRINAEFAAAGDIAGGVVEHAGRAFREDCVVLRAGASAAMKERHQTMPFF